MKACFLDFAFPGIANVHCVFTGRFEGAAPLAEIGRASCRERVF